MRARPTTVRRSIPALVALVPVCALFALSRQPTVSNREAEELARRFRFDRLAFPELSGGVYKLVRDVHPSLRRVSAFISFTGAAVALADLDADGPPNDLVSVDPRVDRVIVAPAPGPRARFDPSSLDPEPLPFDRSTMA